MHHKESGFTLVEGLLVTLIVIVVGFAGYYINNQNEHTVSKTEAQKVAETTKTSDKKPVKETDSWLLYQPPGKDYSIRLADGWVLERYQKDSGLYQFSNDKLALVKGTKAVVDEIQGGKDGDTGFFLNYATENIDQILPQGEQQTSLKTDDGLEVEKYRYVQISGTEGIGLQAGDTQYTYIIRKTSSRVIEAGYSFKLNADDHHDVVEKVIKTAHFN